MHPISSAAGPLAIITVGLLLLRVMLALLVTRPTIMMDERCYLVMARAVAGGTLPYSREYGPLYPTLLAPAAALGIDQGYVWARLVGCALSVCVVPLSFLLLREHVSRTGALWGAALAGILPSHLMTAPLLMAENLFFPLTVLAAWAALHMARNGRGYVLLLCLSSALVLTKKLGWAVVVGLSLYLLPDVWRSRSLRRRCTFVLPIVAAGVAVLVWRTLGVHCEPLCQGLTPTTPIPSTSAFRLTQDTFMQPLATRVPSALVLGAVAWARWMLAHASYLVVICAWLPLFARQWRSGSMSVGFLGLCVAITLMAFSAHHNLEGWQRDQYIRGRYVDAALPLVLGPSLVLAVRNRRRPGAGLLYVGFLLALLFRPEDAVHGQNRNLAWVSPFVQGSPLDPAVGAWVARALVGAWCAGVWLVLRLRRHRRALVVVACLFLVGADGAAAVRLMRQQAWAREYSAIALWLRTHGPQRPLIAVDREATVEEDKKLGLVWVMEQILFWNDADFVRTAREAPFLLSPRTQDLPVLCEARYGELRKYYLYDRRPKRH